MFEPPKNVSSYLPTNQTRSQTVKQIISANLTIESKKNIKRMKDLLLVFTFADLSEVDFRVCDERRLLVLSDGLGAEHRSTAEREDEVDVFVEANVVLGVASRQLTLEGHDLKMRNKFR